MRHVRPGAAAAPRRAADLLLVAIVVVVAAAPAGARDRDAELPGIEKRTEGMVSRQGLLTFHVDERAGRVFLELPPPGPDPPEPPESPSPPPGPGPPAWPPELPWNPLPAWMAEV